MANPQGLTAEASPAARANRDDAPIRPPSHAPELLERRSTNRLIPSMPSPPPTAKAPKIAKASAAAATTTVTASIRSPPPSWEALSWPERNRFRASCMGKALHFFSGGAGLRDGFLSERAPVKDAVWSQTGKPLRVHRLGQPLQNVHHPWPVAAGHTSVKHESAALGHRREPLPAVQPGQLGHRFPRGNAPDRRRRA